MEGCSSITSRPHRQKSIGHTWKDSSRTRKVRTSMLEKLLAKQHVRHLDLKSVRAKVIEKLGWPSDQAEAVEQEYRRFLYALTQKRREEIISPPSQQVDEFWHQHILDTRK